MNNHSKTAEAVTPGRKRKAHSGAKRSVEASTSFDGVAKAIRTRIERERLRRITTLGLYSLKTDDSNFGLPFCAVSDHFALLAQKQLLPLSNCYCLGTVCLLDGKVVSSNKPRLVLDKGV